MLNALRPISWIFGVTVFFSFHAEAGPQCRSYSSPLRGVPVNYCVQRSRPDLKPQQGEAVVYFFHGINGNAGSWAENGYAEAMEVLSREEQFPPFTVLSFDTSRMSFFSDRGDVRTGSAAYETWFVREFIPYAEKTYGVCSSRACRGVAGLSMGGYGALKTALKHNELFGFVAVNSAAVAPFNVWNPLRDWNGYFNRHPVGPWQGQALLQEIRRVFTSKEMYEKNDPAHLALGLREEKDLPKLYIDVGGKDYFGFQEGYFRFTKVLDEKRWAYHSYFEPGGGHDIFHDRRWWLMRFLRDQVLASESP